MAEYRFLHMGVNFKTKSPNTDTLGEIETVLNQAKDWYRYAPNCWLIYTSIGPSKWQERIKQQVPWITEQTYLICVADVTSRAGWLPRDTWDWINKNRQ
jgi:hypothetical protein